jgi:hypothetical protein
MNILVTQIMVNDSQARIWKEEVVDYLKVLSQEASEGIEENHERSERKTCNTADIYIRGL